MGNGRTRRPSAAMLVAMIALSLALGGSAIAADPVTKKEAKKIAKKVAKKQIRKIPEAPFAYALIDQGEVLTSAPSKTITSADVDNPQGGFFCIDLPFGPVTGAATPEAVGNDGIMAFTFVTANYQACPASAEAEVTHYDVNTASFVDGQFYVQFDG